MKVFEEAPSHLSTHRSSQRTTKPVFLTASAMRVVCGFLIIQLGFSLPVSIAQRSYEVTQDSILIGEPLQVELSPGSLEEISRDLLGPWEVWKVVDQTLFLITFQEGIHPLPPLPVMNAAGRIDTLRTTDVVVVSRSAPGDQEAPRPIKALVALPVSWLEWLPIGLMAFGLLLLSLLWLMGFVRSYGPSTKNLPPPSAIAMATQRLEFIAGINSQSEKYSLLQRTLRYFLHEHFQIPAISVAAGELEGLEKPIGFPAVSFAQLVASMKARDAQRYAGSEPSTEQIDTFRRQLAEFFEESQPFGVVNRLQFLQAYGRMADPGRRMLAGITDLLPMTCLMMGGLLWLGQSFVGFEEGGEMWSAEMFARPLVAGTLSLLAALVLRSLLAPITDQGPWQATPGMKLFRLARVPHFSEKSPRPFGLYWLLASLPLFLGHVGIFSKHRESWVDRMSRSQVRHYPSSYS